MARSDPNRSSRTPTLRERLAARRGVATPVPAPSEQPAAEPVLEAVPDPEPVPVPEPVLAPEQLPDPTPTPASAPASAPGSGSTPTPAPAPPRRRTPRIAPHAARHANRVRRRWLAFLFFPVFAIYLVLDALRDIGDRIAHARVHDMERRPPFRRPDGMPPPDECTVEQIVEVVESFPFRPARISTNAAFFRDNGPDAMGALLSLNPHVSTIPHFYPKPFQQRLFTGQDGVQLAGMQAMHEHSGPAIVIAHGLLMTKNFDLIIQFARRAFEDWGMHVATVDLRGWGQSVWTTDAPPSAGFHEGRDLVEVARELHRDPRVTSVAGVGFSLGGASMLNAAHVSSGADDRPFDGGIVAVSPPTDIDSALDHISTKPQLRDPFRGLWHVFGAAIKANVRRHGLGPEVRTWRDMVETLSAPYYGIDVAEFAARASAVNFAQEIDQPVLALHATDDFVVPVQHAFALQEAAAGNPWVHVMVRDAGAHVSFGAADPSWFHSTVRRWVEYWALPGDLRPADRDDPAEDTDAEVG